MIYSKLKKFNCKKKKKKKRKKHIVHYNIIE